MQTAIGVDHGCKPGHGNVADVVNRLLRARNEWPPVCEHDGGGERRVVLLLSLVLLLLVIFFFNSRQPPVLADLLLSALYGIERCVFERLLLCKGTAYLLGAD